MLNFIKQNYCRVSPKKKLLQSIKMKCVLNNNRWKREKMTWNVKKKKIGCWINQNIVDSLIQGRNDTFTQSSLRKIQTKTWIIDTPYTRQCRIFVLFRFSLQVVLKRLHYPHCYGCKLRVRVISISKFREKLLQSRLVADTNEHQRIINRSTEKDK